MASTGMDKSVFLNPGECCWGDHHTSIRTILGSCVAVTLWHPGRRSGGMCHFLLPSTASLQGSNSPRYASGAFSWLMAQIRDAGDDIHEYQGKVFGGGNMFCAESDRVTQVGEQNIIAALDLMKHYGIPLTSRHTGGNQFRAIRFEIATGAVWVSSQTVNNMPGNRQNREEFRG